jgi:hypothetical protein
MRDLVVTPGVVTNCQEITELAARHRDRFTDYPSPGAEPRPFDPYRDSEYEDDDRYHVMQADRMPAELRAAILAGIAPPGIDPARLSGLYVQINRYDQGDYVLPHRDSLQQGLYMLTTSERDALIAQDAHGRAVRVPDRAGTYITHDPGAWHWVDPVVDHTRYTIVTIPALPRPGA